MMAEYMHMAPWVQYAGSSSGNVTPSAVHAHLRSLSPHTPTKQVTKSVSTPHLQKSAQSNRLERSDSEVMNTIPDPRSPTPQPVQARENSSEAGGHHPDLSQEVATLSTKLINAINHQDTLDNTLQQTRHELDATREKLAHYEKKVTEHENLLSAGRLVEREVYQKMEKQLMSELAEEKRRRLEAEKAKRTVDSEVENLTSALFEEANTMVSAARKETEATEKRNDQLKQQLQDADLLQKSLQEQMQDLKLVMEKMSERDDNENNTLPTTTAPSTPGITPADKMSKLFDAASLAPNTPGSEEVTPEQPLHFSHLIQPVLRADLQSFKEFQEMLRTNPRSTPSSRVSSGSYGGLNVLGLGSFTNSSTTSLTGNAKSSNSIGSNSPRDSLAGAGLPNLKDEKFYKRTLAEDVEPTLRLDIAPGLSWMARRTVLNSITAGSLVVEPSPPPPKFRGLIMQCSLCGEARKGDQYARKFRFKTSDTDETKYPLCDWCLGRVRVTCDYIGFLRMVAAGHWRAETEQERKNAWEENVRLRERMFWARIGGGVVPAFVANRESPRSPTFANGTGQVDGARTSEESQISINKAMDSAVDVGESGKDGRKSEEDPFRIKDGNQLKRVSIGRTVISSDSTPVGALAQEDESRTEAEVEAQLQTEMRKSMRIEAGEVSGDVPTDVMPEPSPQAKEERLSLTIPGAFE